MAIKKLISTALYNPIEILYRHKGNLVEVRLPMCALNVEVFFADEDALQSFSDEVDYFLKRGLIVFDKVNNDKALEKQAEKSKKQDLESVSNKINKNIQDTQDNMGFKNAKINTTVEKG